jgi:hypothetical protein
MLVAPVGRAPRRRALSSLRGRRVHKPGAGIQFSARDIVTKVSSSLPRIPVIASPFCWGLFQNQSYTKALRRFCAESAAFGGLRYLPYNCSTAGEHSPRWLRVSIKIAHFPLSERGPAEALFFELRTTL